MATIHKFNESHRLRETNMNKKILYSLILALVAAAIPQAAWADTLELRNGQIVQGKFLGGSPLNIRFEVAGQEQIFATRDVLNISFTDTSVDASNAAASGVPGASSSNAPPAADTPPGPDVSSGIAAPGPLVQQTGNAVTIPSGTSLLVRMIDSVDSSKNNVGDIFHASLETPLVVGDTVVAPKGADVYGKLAHVKEAGKISGGAQLTLELTGVRIGGDIVPIDSTTYDVAGKGRGKQSAGRIGGGAALGAIIGGIAGGGSGAAIGAGVGAAAGTTVQLVTHGEKIRIPSETLLEFKTERDVMAPFPGSSR